MDITSLLYFITVCKYGNFTKASTALHISQSALSRRIKSIEEELDVLLIERGSGSFSLTDVGNIFLADAERIVKQNDRMLRHVDKYRHNDSIRIGFSQNLYLRPYIDAVCKVKTTSPDKMFYFRESSLKSIADDLKKGNLDIIYTTRGEVDGLPGINCVTVAENDASILVPRGHRLWNKTTISFSDLEGERICTINDNELKSPTASRTVSAMITQGFPIEVISNNRSCGHGGGAAVGHRRACRLPGNRRSHERGLRCVVRRCRGTFEHAQLLRKRHVGSKHR